MEDRKWDLLYSVVCSINKLAYSAALEVAQYMDVSEDDLFDVLAVFHQEKAHKLGGK